MIFNETPIKECFIISLDKKSDSRGFFARTFCLNEFKERNLAYNFPQSNISENKYKKTTRGLHYQVSPYAEDKLIRCLKGSIYDVCVDLRKDSPTYLQWFGIELTESNYQALYVPKGCAHGYQTLTDNTLVFYQVSQFYTPNAERGILWNDPQLNINWPYQDETIISKKDRSLSPFSNFSQGITNDHKRKCL